MVITGSRFEPTTISINALVDDYLSTRDPGGQSYRTIETALLGRGFVKEHGARFPRYRRNTSGVVEIFSPGYDFSRQDPAAYFRVVSTNAPRVIELLHLRDSTYHFSRKHYWAAPATGALAATLNAGLPMSTGALSAGTLSLAAGGFIAGTALGFALISFPLTIIQVRRRDKRRKFFSSEIASYSQSAFGRDAYLHALGQPTPHL